MRSFFKLKNKVYLPLDMHKEGLIVIGSHDSSNRKFTQKYTLELINKNANVICITDSDETISLVKHAAKCSDHANLYVADISKSLNSLSFASEGGVALFSVSSYKFKSSMGDDYEKFTINFVRLLTEVLNSDFQGKEVVLIIDEKFELPREFTTTMINLLKSIQKSSIGLVFSWSDRYGYPAIDFIENYIVFHIYDPLEMIQPFRHTRWSSRDITSLGDDEFFYRKKSEVTQAEFITICN